MLSLFMNYNRKISIVLSGFWLYLIRLSHWLLRHVVGAYTQFACLLLQLQVHQLCIINKRPLNNNTDNNNNNGETESIP